MVAHNNFSRKLVILLMLVVAALEHAYHYQLRKVIRIQMPLNCHKTM